MKLLIVTQVLDTEHPILGFFHRWVEEFSKYCERVHVICLEEGKYDLPDNVTVHSLGKETERGNKIIYTLRFYSLIWKLRHEYDNVFVHMNQIYVILGTPLWRILGKKIGLWYAHGTVSLSLRIAEKFTNKIFTASSESFRLDSEKVFVTGHGIDTNLFLPKETIKDLDLITVGRISKSKNLFVLVDILKESRKVSSVTLTILGISVTAEEKKYENTLKQYVEKLELSSVVTFLGKVEQKDLPNLLNRAKVFVTAAQNGSLDKAMLEPMACGLQVVSMAKGSTTLPLGDNQVDSCEEFVQELDKVLESKVFTIQSHSDFVRLNHSLKTLIPKIINSYAK